MRVPLKKSDRVQADVRVRYLIEQRTINSLSITRKQV